MKIQSSKFKVQILTVLLICILTGVVFAKEGDLWQTTGNATVREEPTTSSGVVSYLKQGVMVEEIAQQGNWLKVKSLKTGVTGWVHKSLLVPVTKDLKSQCEGVQGFSAVCPIQKEVKVLQGQQIEQSTQKVTPQPGVVVTGQGQPQPVTIPTLPKNINELQNTQPGVDAQQGGGIQQAQINQVNANQLLNTLESTDMINTSVTEQFTGTAYIVEPEKTTIVKMSSSDVNRIVCPVDIKDVVYSEEKGIQVKISGKNAFVKFLIKRIAGKETYSKIPADIYVVCGDKVYSIIAMPERIPSVSVYLEDKEQKIKETLEKNQTMPYERKILNYVKDFMSGKTPPEATFTKVDKEYKLYNDLEIRERANYAIEGEGFTVRVFQIISKKPGIEIKEKDFLRKEITQNPLAISLDRLKLNQGEKAILLIIEKTRG